MNRFSTRLPFSSWSPASVPAVAAGVYAIWERDLLLYCGMSGRGFNPESVNHKKKHGLVTRLQSHASGRLSGDQFCVYVANRLVIPAIQTDQLVLFKSGKLSLDQLTKAYIHERLDFQFTVTRTGSEAYLLEEECRSGIVFSVKPLLNPL